MRPPHLPRPPAALAETGGSVALDDLAARTAAFTDDGQPVTDREEYARTDLLYALRSLGWTDTGNPGVPVFRRG